MKPSEDLFILIKSLTQNEKRHFAIYADKYSGQGMRNYILIFREIDKMKVYDEKVILQKYRKEAFTNQIHVTKNYLYKLILTSLRSFHAVSSVELKIKNLLQDVEVLFNEKALYQQCYKLLKKAKGLAVTHEKFIALQEISEWEYRVAFALEDMERLEALMTDDFSEEQLSMEKHLEKRKFQQLHTKVFLIMRKKATVRDIELRKKYDHLFASSFLQKSNGGSSIQAGFYFHTLHFLYYDKRSEYRKAFEAAGKALKCIESKIDVAIDQPTYYVIGLNNFLLTALKIKEYPHFLSALEKMKAMTATLNRYTQHIELRIFKIVNLSELRYMIMRTDIDGGRRVVKNISAGLKTYEGMIDKTTEVGFIFNTSYFYFLAGEYRLAKQWLSKLIIDRNDKVREDLFSLARILNLLIHFELNDMDTLSYVIQSSRRYLSGKNLLYKTEESVLSFFKGVLNSGGDKNDLLKLQKKFKDEISYYLNDPYERTVVEFIDLLSWITSRMEGRSFYEVVKQKKG